MNSVILKVNNLVKHFPITGGIFGKVTANLQAVDGISFALNKGRTLGLVGESGCGKSTLGRTILKLLEPTSGQIIFNNEDITNFSEKRMRPLRKQMQIIFQDPYGSLNPRFSIEQILSEPFQIHNLYKKKEERLEIIQEIMKEVGLNPLMIDRYPHEFSGGQRQRIGIARALCLKPELIVCDEPVSALDVSIQSQILNLLMDLKERYNLSLIFIAHDLAVIEHISDDVGVMYLGEMIEYAPVNSLYKTPTHPYTKILLSSIPKRELVEKKARELIQGDVPSAINPPKGCRFNTRCPYAKDICRNITPKLENVSVGEPSHLVACHFSKDFL